MNVANGLLLNEELLGQVQEIHKPIFVLEWLRVLDVALLTVNRNEIKTCQKQLVDQLLQAIQSGPGPSARNLTSRCMAKVFIIGDTINLFDTVNRCNDFLKSRDDSPSSLLVKLAATSCLGEMYEKLGRMMGRSYEETVQILSKSFKNMESQSRIETMLTCEKICSGMDSAANSVHKEIYKIARICLTDRVMPVRTAAAKCIIEMSKSASFLYTTEMESLASLCFRALDGADYDSRIAIAELLGYTISCTQQLPNFRNRNAPMPTSMSAAAKGAKPISLEDSLNTLMTGFLRGATSFLKGDIIKGSSGVNREVRVGVTHAYVAFVERMGAMWLEKHLETFTTHVLELVANQKATTSHVDCVYSRKCVNFILRRTFGGLLSEKAQFSAVKVLAAIILKQMNSIDFNPENAKECNQETIFNQHLLVCALQELSALFLALDTSIHHYVIDPTSKLMDGIFSVLVHPSSSTRLSGAWTLRCLCVACPSEAHKAIERCLLAFETMKSSPEAVAGYSAALAALLGAVRHMPLGIPYATGKIVFNTSEELLRSANQNSRLSVQKSSAGWLLIGSIMTLGNSVVKALLPRMLLLWRNSFPKTASELESEKARGDAFTWQVTLEGRAGALSSIQSFLLHCPDLVTDEIITRLLIPIESALAMMTNLSSTLKTYGQQLKAAAAILRFRLYETLVLIKPSSFERSYTHMLRFVIWELTLNDNAANTTTSLFTRVCQSNSIFNCLVSDHMSIEDQLQPIGAAGSGAIEHDPCSLYKNLPECSSVPIPLPLGVSVIDAAIELFGQLYPHISSKHRAQLIEHFVECLKVTKYARKEAVLINIFCAILCALKTIRKLNTASSDIAGRDPTKGVGPDELKSLSQQLVLGSLNHTNPTIRCAAAEVLGRIAQSVAEMKFTSEAAQMCSDKIKASREVSSRMGHSLALGCLHRYLGGMDSSRHQHMSVSILLNLASDSSSPETQMWALHSLALIADTGGPLFRSYVEPSLSLVIKLIVTVPLSSVDLRQATGKMLAALITGIGPELQGGGDKEVEKIRKSFHTGCALLAREEEHPLVQNEAVTCFQRLHLFGGNVNFEMVIPVLYRSIKCTNLALRRTAVDCLRQFSQRDADIVCQQVLKLCEKDTSTECPDVEYGLSGILFTMLDKESDNTLRKGIRDTLRSIFSAAVFDSVHLQTAISLCKSILTADSGTEDGTPEEQIDDFDDDVAEFKIGNDEISGAVSSKINSKWTSRVFAAECVRKILITSPHITNKTGPELLRHLSDLIRMSFMGATSSSDSLRLEGLLNLETIIEKFAELEDPDFPSVSILEQFQAQVSAALRPAFSVETDPNVKATACRVCSAWICGNSQGGEDLRRVHTLMVSALENIRSKPTLPDYNEKANTLEKLAILKAWAQVFIASVENGIRKGESLVEILKLGVKTKNHLLELVKPEIELLFPLWNSALRDRALIELPAEFSPQLPREGGAFFSNETKDVVRPFYCDSWASILYATAICVSTLPELAVNKENAEELKESKLERFHLVFGLSMEALCKPTFSEPMDSIVKYLKSLWALLSSHWPRDVITQEKDLAIELCCVLHKQLVTHSDIKVQSLVIEILALIIEAMRENFNKISQQLENAACENNKSEELMPGKSVVLSILEVIFCLLMQKIPVLNSNISGFYLKPTGTTEENSILVSEVVKCLDLLPEICSDEAAIEIQPTILYLSTCVLGEADANDVSCPAVLHCFRKLATHRLNANPSWEKYLLSTLVKLLDMAKTGGDESAPSTPQKKRLHLLFAISIFINETPPHLLRIPNVLYPSINLYQQAIQSEEENIRVKSMGLVSEIFEKADRSVGTPFIHALAPRILQYLYSDEARNVQTKPQLELALESIRAIQILVQIVDNSEKRVQMLTLIVPVLINFLYDPAINAVSTSPHKKVLHELSLQKLMKIGPQYPQEFRTLMGQSNEMRIKLEAAIKNSRAMKQTELTGPLTPGPPSTNTPGSIKLKTDFSNFSR